MAHATIADVFDSFSRAASRGMEMISKEQEYIRNMGLFDASVDLDGRRNRIARARETVYDDSGINYKKVEGYPETFQEYVDKNMREWRSTWQNRYAGRYFADNLHELESRGKLAIQQTVLSAEAEYAAQKIDAEYDDGINGIFNNPEYTVQQKREMARQLTDYTRGAPGWDEAKYNRKTGEYLGRALAEGLQFTPGLDGDGKPVTVDAIRERYGNIAKELRTGDPGAATDEEKRDGIYARLKGAGDSIKLAKESAILGQQAFNFKGLLELDAGYDTAVENYRTAVQKGDAAGVTAAYNTMMSLYRAGKPVKDAALDPEKKASEYNPENRPQIVTMFPDPPGSGGGEPKRAASQESAIKNAVQRWINGFVDAEFSMDATGRLTGFTTTDGVYYTGLSLSAIYQGLDRMAEEAGWNVAPGQMHYEFKNELLKRLGNRAETSEAKRVVSQLVSFSESQWKEIQKRTGEGKDAIGERMTGQILDAYARYSSSADPSPQKNAILEQALNGIRDQYIAPNLYFLYDDRNTSGSTYTRNVLGTLGDLGKALDAYHKNPSINLPGGSGGRNIPAHLDDNFRAYTNRAQALAREELGAASTGVEGGDVIARDRNGNKYRVGGTEGGNIFLYEPDGKGGWTPIAQRETGKENEHGWIVTKPNGEPEMIPGQEYSSAIPLQYRQGPRKLPPDRPGPKKFKGL
jgi:hypothetical protein